jgi:hypothetical protein
MKVMTIRLGLLQKSTKGQKAMKFSKVRNFSQALPLTAWTLFMLAAMVLSGCNPDPEPPAEEAAQPSAESPSEATVSSVH